MIRDLQTAGDVIEALGGAAATARLTGKKSQHIWNWKKANRFPPHTFLILSAELERLGCTAAPSLWGITERAEAES